MKNRYLNIFLFILTAVIISLIVPSNTSFNYEFSVGQVWHGDKIVASFDFPIKKDFNEYQNDVELCEENYIPIYSRDSVLSKRIIFDIESLFASSATLTESQKLEINKVVEDVVAVGILDTLQGNHFNGVVRVVDDGVISPISVADLYSCDLAEQHLMNKIYLITPDKYAQIQLIKDKITPNIIYSTALNDKVKALEVAKISKSKGFMAKGSVLLKKGDDINSTTYNILESYRMEFYKRGAVGFSLLPYLGNLVYLIIIMMLSYMSLKSFRPDTMEKIQNVLFLLILYTGSVSIMTFVTHYTSQNIYIIPFLIVPLYISAFYSSRMSVHQYVYVLMISALIAPKPIEFILINFIGGVVAVLIIKSSYRRHAVLFAALGALLAYICVYASLSFISGDYVIDDYSVFIWFVINIFITVVLYQFLFIIEKGFNFVTKITLFDLCDTNNKLLRELALNAPGTFQHSMQVSNLAENAAKAIGANAMLARTGALYHDIGKSVNPGFFTENVPQGSDPHSELTPLESADVIRRHVADGIALARRYNLPSVVVEFIESHHANSSIYYFYRKQMELTPDEDVDIAEFSYPHPKPVSKEASICLICDSVEAASRSLKVYTEDSIEKLIDSIVSHQIEDELLSDSMLQLNEIDKIKESLRNYLMTIYHSRISYPKRK